MADSYAIITKRLKDSYPDYDQKMIYNPDLMIYERLIDFEYRLDHPVKENKNAQEPPRSIRRYARRDRRSGT